MQFHERISGNSQNDPSELSAADLLIFSQLDFKVYWQTACWEIRIFEYKSY